MTVAADAPILFFDSGVGGLSILAPVREMLPTASIVYAADSAGFPYGTKSEAEIAARVPALLGRLVERYRPRLAVIACNTASTLVLPALRQRFDEVLGGREASVLHPDPDPPEPEDVTRDVLADLGYDRGQVDDLIADGVAFTERAKPPA